MVSPSDEDRKCAMFDSFSKTASRNYYRDLLRAEKRRDKNYQEEPVEYILELLGREDSYPSDFFVLYVDGHSCVVESETLYKALTSLPEKQRTVVFSGCRLSESGTRTGLPCGFSIRLPSSSSNLFLPSSFCISVRPSTFFTYGSYPAPATVAATASSFTYLRLELNA